jgi:predicted metal-dependent enzyme (double-stranded beta helix superfamily)
VTVALAVDALTPLRNFVRDLGMVLESDPDEATILSKGRVLLAELVACHDWLPESHAVPDPARYRQYLLYRDPVDRFSVVSFVWGPGQHTPIHDHTVWGLIGMLRGSEIADSYERINGGLRRTASTRLDRGQVDAVSPMIGDLHYVSNAYDDRVSVSIHVYGADIGKVRRSIYDLAGNPRPFISGYASAPALNL